MTVKIHRHFLWAKIDINKREWKAHFFRGGSFSPEILKYKQEEFSDLRIVDCNSPVIF